MEIIKDGTKEYLVNITTTEKQIEITEEMKPLITKYNKAYNQYTAQAPIVFGITLLTGLILSFLTIFVFPCEEAIGQVLGYGLSAIGSVCMFIILSMHSKRYEVAYNRIVKKIETKYFGS